MGNDPGNRPPLTLVSEDRQSVKTMPLPPKKGKGKLKAKPKAKVVKPLVNKKKAKVVEPEKPKDGKVSSLAELVDRFIDSQSNSEDACHAQLLEAKHQLNSLRELVTDLVEEVNTTEKAMILYDKELQEKLQKLADIQVWRDEQIK